VQLGAQPRDLGGELLELAGLVVPELLAALELRTQVRGFAIVAGDRRGHRAVAIRAARAPASLAAASRGAFAQGPHQASCSATARPSRLIAMRLVRPSASSP
jgi:hypothetical protein